MLKNRADVTSDEIGWLEKQNPEQIDLTEVEQKCPPIQNAFYLVLLRNVISHNKLPERNVFAQLQKQVVKEERESYSAYFQRVTEILIANLGY